MSAIRPRKSLESALHWADALSELAKELPDSSYAPYAAYYAGCAYLAAIEHSVLEKLRNPVADREEPGQRDRDWPTLLEAERNSLYFGKAEDAIGLAVEKADAYLMPRAVYMKAYLHAFDLEATAAMLEEAANAAPGDPVMEEMVGKLRRMLEEARANRTHVAPNDSDRGP